MIDVPGCPSEQYVFDDWYDQHIQHNTGFFMFDRSLFCESIHQRQAHHNPEQLWSRDK